MMYLSAEIQMTSTCPKGHYMGKSDTQNTIKTEKDIKFMQTVGGKVKKLRSKEGLKQSVLTELLGYSGDSAISKLENEGSNIDIIKLNKLSIYFGVSIAYLCGETDCENINPNIDIMEKYEKVIEASNTLHQTIMDIFPETQKEN